MPDNLTTQPNDIKDHPDLYRRTVKGGFWVFALRILTQAISYVRYIILVRELAITDIGLLGVAMLMIQVLGTFTATGFRAAIIQKKEETKSYLDTAWTAGIIRAIVLFTILYLAAPYAAMLKVPQEKVQLTINIIRVIGLTLIINSISNIGVIYFRKELKFNKYFIFQISGTLVSSAITIFIALKYQSVWALVLGRLAASIVRCFLSYLIHPYRPRLSLDLSKAAKLWKFGKWIFAGTVLGFLMTQGDDFFVWAYLGISALGLYQVAYKFSNIPATEITHVISQVTFPAYSKLQDDIPRLKDAYLKVLQLTAFLSIPAAGLIFILTPDFVTLFLKKEFLPIIPVMQILAIKGLMSSIGATWGPLFQAVKRVDIEVNIKLIRLVMLVIIIYPLTAYWNIAGTALAIVLISAVTFPFVAYSAMKIIRCSTWEMLKPLFFPFIATLIMVTVIFFIKISFTEIIFVSFFLLAIIAAGVYISASFIFDRFLGYGIKSTIQSQLNILTGKVQ